MSRQSNPTHLVFFGATGDLAYKKIFPALQAMVEAWPPQRAGHRRRQGRLEPRTIQGARARQPRRTRRSRPGGIREAAAACCATSMATTTIPRHSTRCARSWAQPAAGALPGDSAVPV